MKRCKFGRAHLWIRRPNTELDVCATCGKISYDATYPEDPRELLECDLFEKPCPAQCIGAGCVYR